MPNRILREGILDSEAVNALSFPAEVFYRRLMSVVDDFGRFDGRAAVLRCRLYPLRIDAVREADIPRWIAECEKAGLIALYTVDAKPYILFHKLGSPRAKESKFPAPPEGLRERLHVPPAAAACEHVRADADTCAQTRADVPYSYSGSGTSSGTSSIPLPADAGGAAVVIPPELDTPEFRAAWGEWKADRRDRRIKPYSVRGETATLRKLAAYGPAVAVEAVRESIRQQWQGLFPEKVKGAGPRLHTPPPADAPQTMQDLLAKYGGERKEAS